MSLVWLMKLSIQKQPNSLRFCVRVGGGVRGGGKKISCPVSCIEMEKRSWWDLCLPPSLLCSLIDWIWPSVVPCSLSCLAQVRPVCLVLQQPHSCILSQLCASCVETSDLSFSVYSLEMKVHQSVTGWLSSRYKMCDSDLRYQKER